jgi:hypothetical protein
MAGHKKAGDLRPVWQHRSMCTVVRITRQRDFADEQRRDEVSPAKLSPLGDHRCH